MREVTTSTGLLVMALLDLRDGELAMRERLRGVSADIADGALCGLVEADHATSAARHEAMTAMLAELGQEGEDTENIWLRAILDDAANDTRTIARGPLRDIALAGALRKAKQAQRVSYETAIALARATAREGSADRLAAMADGAEETDTALATALFRLARDLD